MCLPKHHFEKMCLLVLLVDIADWGGLITRCYTFSLLSSNDIAIIRLFFIFSQFFIKFQTSTYFSDPRANPSLNCQIYTLYVCQKPSRLEIWNKVRKHHSIYVSVKDWQITVSWIITQHLGWTSMKLCFARIIYMYFPLCCVCMICM